MNKKTKNKIWEVRCNNPIIDAQFKRLEKIKDRLKEDKQIMG